MILLRDATGVQDEGADLRQTSVARSSVRRAWGVIACGSALAAGVTAQAGDLVLVRNGQARAVIVTADAPTPVARSLAR